MFPWSHPNSSQKLDHDRFKRFCAAHGRPSLYFTMGCPYPLKNCPFPWGDLGTHLIDDSLVPSEPKTLKTPNGISISIGSTVFAQMTAECPYRVYRPYAPQNCHFQKWRCSNGRIIYHFLLVICSNNVSVLHRFRDSSTFIACDLKKAFTVDTAIKIIGWVYFSIRVWTNLI